MLVKIVQHPADADDLGAMARHVSVEQLLLGALERFGQVIRIVRRLNRLARGPQQVAPLGVLQHVAGVAVGVFSNGDRLGDPHEVVDAPDHFERVVRPHMLR